MIGTERTFEHGVSPSPPWEKGSREIRLQGNRWVWAGEKHSTQGWAGVLGQRPRPGAGRVGRVRIPTAGTGPCTLARRRRLPCPARRRKDTSEQRPRLGVHAASCEGSVLVLPSAHLGPPRAALTLWWDRVHSRSSPPPRWRGPRNVYAACAARPAWCSAKSANISRLKAGRSAGLRLLTQLRSRSTSASCHSAPAFLRSS